MEQWCVIVSNSDGDVDVHGPLANRGEAVEYRKTLLEASEWQDDGDTFWEFEHDTDAYIAIVPMLPATWE